VFIIRPEVTPRVRRVQCATAGTASHGSGERPFQRYPARFSAASLKSVALKGHNPPAMAAKNMGKLWTSHVQT